MERINYSQLIQEILTKHSANDSEIKAPICFLLDRLIDRI